MPESNTPARSVHRAAEISLEALRDNLAALGGAELSVDLRAGAYGHGLDLVVPTLVAAGVRELIVSDDVDRAPGGPLAAMLAGSETVARVAPSDGARVVGPELFGLTDRGLRPVMRFVGEVLARKRLHAGDGVSYGATYRRDRDTTLALIGVGYSHGAVRRASNRAHVLVGGAKRIIAGAISMDQLSVDLDGAPLVSVGDEAVLFGDPARGEPHVLDWAEATGIPAEAITSRISADVTRVAVDAGTAVETASRTETNPASGRAAGAADAATPNDPLSDALRGSARRPVARIDLAALGANVARLVAAVAPARAMLVVKSDAYGHDLLPCVQAGLAAGATSLGALEIDAGIALRRAGVTVPLFAWVHGAKADFRAAIEHGIDLGVSAAWQLDAIAAAAAEATTGIPRVHLKIDTGLHRSGADPEDWPALVERAVALERGGSLRLVAAWSHLSDTSEEADERSLDRFAGALEQAKELGADLDLRHVGASSAALEYPHARYDLVRLGIAAYGISPFDDRSGRDLGVRPVMTLVAPVLEVRGDRATIGIGYGDGMQCVRGVDTFVSIRGRRVRVVDVGPDISTVDLSQFHGDSFESDAPDAIAVGDEAIVFGTGDDGAPTAEEWARRCETVGDELVTGVTSRVARIPV